ncbi:MAG TPA: hypothetical protein VII73_10870 [Caulobacteraceae bacterium]
MQRLIVVVFLTLSAAGSALARMDDNPLCPAYRGHWEHASRGGDLEAMAGAAAAIPAACPGLRAEADGRLAEARRRASEREQARTQAEAREHAAGAAQRAAQDQAARDKAVRDATASQAAAEAADDAAYDAARRADTIASFDAYLAAYPAGRHLADAQASRQSPEFLKAGADALEHGDNDGAIRALSQALDAGTLAPHDQQRAYVKRGMAYAAKGQKALALADLDQAVKLDPGDRDAVETRKKLLPRLVAELGINTLPALPNLATVAAVSLPGSFCSETERNTFHDRQYVPANQAAFQNNASAKQYLDELNELHAEYDELQSGFANVITHQFIDYQPVAAGAKATSDTYYQMHDTIMRIPVTGTCKN